VILVRGHYVISQLLIDTVLADPVGVGNDGTTAAQVRDTTGNPYGFEISGATSTNLGGVLGLQNGDIITAVSNQPTETYDDLLDVAAMLLSARTATVELTRGTASVTLIYQRGT
jgi:S1-C subfamily serine protease